MATPAAAPTLYYNGTALTFKASDVNGTEEYIAPVVGTKYQVSEDAATGQYNFSDPYTGQSQFNVGGAGWVSSASVAASNFLKDFGATGGAIGSFSATAPRVSSPVVAQTAPVTKTATPVPAPTTPATNAPTRVSAPVAAVSAPGPTPTSVETATGAPGSPTSVTTPGSASNTLLNAIQLNPQTPPEPEPNITPIAGGTSSTTGTGNSSTEDPNLAALIAALSGSGAGTQYGQSGLQSLPPSTILPTDTSGGATTTTTSSNSPSTTDLLVIGVIGSLIATLIYFVVFKKVRNLKELEKAI
jgi:hypothetical protein